MKTTCTAAVLVIAGLALVVPQVLSHDGRPVPPAYTWADMNAIREEGRLLDERAEQMRRFHAAVRQAEDGLLCGALALEEAADIVLASARNDNPQFEQLIKQNVSARTDRERMMRVLLERIQAVEQSGLLSPSQKAHAGQLRCAFENELPLN